MTDNLCTMYLVGDKEVERKEFFIIRERLSLICRYTNYNKKIVGDSEGTYVRIKLSNGNQTFSYNSILDVINTYY